MDKSVFEITRHLPRFSLEKLSLVKIITTLCSNPHLLNLILRCNFEYEFRFRLSSKNEPAWKAVEEKAIELLDALFLPSLIKKSILEFLWPVSCKILLWKFMYSQSIGDRFLQCFDFAFLHWTDRGRINSTRTIRHAIRNKNIPVGTRFDLSCSAFLVNEIHEIWEEMPNKDKEYAANREKASPLVFLWARYFKWLHDDIDEYIDHAAVHAVDIGLFEAVKGILLWCNQDKRQNLARRLYGRLNAKFRYASLEEDDIHIAYFLFFEMKEDYQNYILNTNYLQILSLLFRSSAYELCLSFLEKRLSSFSEVIYDEAGEPHPISDICAYLQFVFFTYHLEVVNDDECRDHFVDVWRMIPDKIRTSDLLTRLGTEITIMLILDNFPIALESEAEEKIGELTSVNRYSLTTSEHLAFHQSKWELLKFFIEKEVTTIPLMERNKINILNILEDGPSHTDVWKRLLDFVSNILNKKNQRK